MSEARGHDFRGLCGEGEEDSLAYHAATMRCPLVGIAPSYSRHSAKPRAFQFPKSAVPPTALLLIHAHACIVQCPALRVVPTVRGSGRLIAGEGVAPG